jgi:hypothetical protein
MVDGVSVDTLRVLRAVVFRWCTAAVTGAPKACGATSVGNDVRRLTPIVDSPELYAVVPRGCTARTAAARTSVSWRTVEVRAGTRASQRVRPRLVDMSVGLQCVAGAPRRPASRRPRARGNEMACAGTENAVRGTGAVGAKRVSGLWWRNNAYDRGIRVKSTRSPSRAAARARTNGRASDKQSLCTSYRTRL